MLSIPPIDEFKIAISLHSGQALDFIFGDCLFFGNISSEISTFSIPNIKTKYFE